MEDIKEVVNTVEADATKAVEKVEQLAVVALSAEQKLRILIAHRAYIVAQNAFEKASKAINDAAMDLAKEIGVDPNKYTVNLETLSLDPVK